MTEVKISSTSNPRIKFIQKLIKSGRTRRQEQLFVVEGAKELEFALKAGFEFHSGYYLEEPPPIDAPTFRIARRCMDVITYRNTSEVLAVVHTPKPSPLTKLPQRGTFLVCDHLEKPGNIGAILRTADASKLDGVIVHPEDFEIYNSNIIRSSVGCVFHIPIYKTSPEKLCTLAYQADYAVYVATPESSEVYTEVTFSDRTILVVGSEDKGVSDFWKKNSTQNIRVPMLGENDSLNVSVCAAILVYERLRQAQS